jgi:hypothetical protein
LLARPFSGAAAICTFRADPSTPATWDLAAPGTTFTDSVSPSDCFFSSRFSGSSYNKRLDLSIFGLAILSGTLQKPCSSDFSKRKIILY